VTVGPEALRGAALGRLITALRRPVQQAWRDAQRQLFAKKVRGKGQLAGASFSFTGAGESGLTQAQRKYLQEQLRALIDAATGLPPKAPHGAAWRERGYSFVARFDRFVDVIRPVWSASYVHELEARHGEHMRDRVEAHVWVIDVTRPVALTSLLREFEAAQRVRLGSGPFILFRSRNYERELRALDPARLTELPHLHSDELVYPAGVTREQAQLSAGWRLMYAAARLPAESSTPAVEFAAPASVEVPFIELLTILELQRLEKLYAVKAWDAFLALYADWPVPVTVLRVIVKRSVHYDVVARMAEERATEIEADAAQFGTLYELTPASVQSLPIELSKLVEPSPSVPAEPSQPVRPGYWVAGARGMYLAPHLAEFAARAYVAEHAQELSLEARELARILESSDGFFSADRYDALRKFLLTWRHERGPLAMEVLFRELDRLGKFDSLFTLLREHYALDGWMRVYVIQNVTGTSFQSRRGVQQLVQSMNAIRREIRMQITWDPATGELVFVHSGQRVKPAGNRTDHGAGIIGEVEGYFSQRTVVSRPKKAALDRLAEPTRRKLGELMLAMMCQEGETRTREELIQRAIQEAADEVKLTEKDFDRVGLQISYRVITVERTTEHGLDQVYVTLQPVRRFADDDWEDAGTRERIPLEWLDGRLESIHVDHLVKALGTFLLIETLIVGIAVVAVTGGVVGLIELALAITIREIMYLLETPGADRDLDGYLTAALYGVVDTLGFRLGGKLAAKLTGRIVTSKALSLVTKQWVVYATKGLAASSALGATQVVEKFADDLIHLSHCRRWSSPWEYFKVFGAGFAMGLAFEFVVIPGLSVAGRAAIRSLANRFGASAKEVAEELAKHVKPEELEAWAEQGAQRLEQALVNTVKDQQASWVRSVMQALRDQIKAVVEHAKAVPEPRGVLAKLRAEWTTRAVTELFEASRLPLDRSARTAVEQLVRTVPGNEMNTIVESLLRSPRTRLLLSTNPEASAGLLSGVFKRAPGRLEELLGALSNESATDAARVLNGLARLSKLKPDEVLSLLELLKRPARMEHVVADETVRNVLAHRPEALASLLRNPEAVSMVERAVLDVKSAVPSVPLSSAALTSPLSEAQRTLSESVGSSVIPGKTTQIPPFNLKRVADRAYAEAYLDELYKKAVGAQQELNELTKDIANSTRGKPNFRPEPKSRTRSWDKITKDYGGDASQLTDLAGTNIVYETLDDLYRGLEQARGKLGDRIVYFNDRFIQPMRSGYRDIQMNLSMSNGHVAEFRLHLRSIEDVAVPEHAAYEVRRSIKPVAEDAGRVANQAEQAVENALLADAQRLYNAAVEQATKPQ
jgi:hypothetical protein